MGPVEKSDFEAQYTEMFPFKQDTYKIIVIVDVAKQRVIASGSLIIEKKFINKKQLFFFVHGDTTHFKICLI